MTRFVAAWLLATALGSWWVNRWSHIDERPMPPAAARRWALDALDAALAGMPPPPVPPEAKPYRAAGPVIANAWLAGRIRARHVGTANFAASVRAAAARFRDEFSSTSDTRNRIRFTITVPLGEGPIARGVPYLSALDLVPLREGVVAEIDGQRAYATPDELWAAGSYDRAVVTPIPDLAFGANLDAIAAGLARSLGVEPERFARDGTLRRFRAGTIARDAYPGGARMDVATLERAAADGARFLLHHQRGDGSYAYVYDGRTDQAVTGGAYSLPRHAATTYFLARAARTLGLPEARDGARRALEWTRRRVMHTCGAPDRLCVVDAPHRASVGSAALTALAATELLTAGDAPALRPMLDGLLAFVRSMQRADGELMHEYDLAEQRPIDVQEMYYSGEAVFALVRAHALLGRKDDLAAAQRLMRHLTGAGWGFFGSRYFYGEEHWTCQAVAADSARAEDAAGLDFCVRWLAFQRRLQYGPSETPWASEGSYGVGPFLVPRVTATASRCEAGAPIYLAARSRGRDTTALRRQIERGVAFLLRLQWRPGPTHLLFDPVAARGGVPETQASPRARNDFVQHAGGAMLSWAEVLRAEAVARRAPERRSR